MVDGFIPYEIVSQTETSELTPDGHFADVWEVRFRTPTGTVGMVRVPDNTYVPELVDRLIQEKVRQIETVHRLGEAPLPEFE